MVERLLPGVAPKHFQMRRERLSSSHHSLFAFSPVKFCQRCITTSAQPGLMSSAWQDRSVISAAMIVVPDPTNGSYTAWPGEELFSIGRFMHSVGFCVPWPVSDLMCSMCQTVDCPRPPDHEAVPFLPTA